MLSDKQTKRLSDIKTINDNTSHKLMFVPDLLDIIDTLTADLEAENKKNISDFENHLEAMSKAHERTNEMYLNACKQFGEYDERINALEKELEAARVEIETHKRAVGKLISLTYLRPSCPKNRACDDGCDKCLIDYAYAPTSEKAGDA